VKIPFLKKEVGQPARDALQSLVKRAAAVDLPQEIQKRLTIRGTVDVILRRAVERWVMDLEAQKEHNTKLCLHLEQPPQHKKQWQNVAAPPLSDEEQKAIIQAEEPEEVMAVVNMARDRISAMAHKTRSWVKSSLVHSPLDESHLPEKPSAPVADPGRRSGEH